MKTFVFTHKHRVFYVLAAVVAVAVGGPIQVSRGDTAVGANLFDPGDPWLNPNYQPEPGKWQPYVRSPLNRHICPIRVLAVLPRGGRVAGDPNRLLNGKGMPVRLISVGDRTQSPLVILDFGREIGGMVHVGVLGASAARPELHASFSESRNYQALQPQDNNGEAAYAPGSDTANIWVGFPGIPYTDDRDSHTLPLNSAALPGVVADTQIRGGFRYLTLFLDGPGSIDLDQVSVEFTPAPEQRDLRDYQGWFLCSDHLLNKIWYAGAYTVQLNTGASDTAKSWPYRQGERDHADNQVPYADPKAEVIYDGAKRDRIVWQGDLSVQAPVTYLSTADIPAVDNSLASLAAQQLPDGYMPAESLVGQHNRDEERTYGEYVTWFINNMAVHWLYTGDKVFLQRWWPALQSAAAWLESVRAQDPQGLIAFQTVGSCGHYGYSDCGHETYVNALYVRNLMQMAELATALDEGTTATTYQSRADSVAEAINSQLWDDSAGAYRLSREITNAYPQDANATAVLTGVANSDRAKRALNYLQTHNWSSLGALTVSPETPNPSVSPFYSPLPSGFEVEARLTANDPTGQLQLTALQLMRSFWGYQLSQDPGSSFWEHVEPDGTPNLKQFSSLAHGWAAGPVISLTTEVLGVQPTDPGFSRYTVIPHPADLAWAQGRVPTPYGPIDVGWEREANGQFTMDISAPVGTTGRLVVPILDRAVTVKMDGQIIFAGQAWSPNVKSDGATVSVDDVTPGHHRLLVGH
jgi:Bacterial alpha-L-rhamnosidase C-terminal domain/Bacterial alpha-L-rhamnosidase 6 hairpin glycosidase domain